MRDDFDSVVADRFKVLDDVPVPDTWSRVLDRVPARDTQSRVPFGDEALTMFDLETPVPTEPRRKRPRRVGLAVVLAAVAAVVAIALVVNRDSDDRAPAVPIAPSRVLSGSLGAQLAPGTYFVDDLAGTPTPRIYFTIGTGWSKFLGEGIAKSGPTPTTNSPEDDIGFITFSRPKQVYLDACHLDKGFHPGPVTTLDGLVTALVEQQGGWHVTAAPSDISVDGYPGKTFQRTAPAVFTDCTLMTERNVRVPEVGGGTLRSWLNKDNSGVAGYYYEPGQVETLLVLDLDGTVVVVNTNLWSGPTKADRAEFAAVLDSIRIDPA